ncbi:hypothetical protein SUGI_0527170 [Cryptomeria japonica]|nr:hypothetical protein SUGI_0527170 [Cryptomeria japonica]
MYEIPSEYWEESILKDIEDKLGTFILLDEIMVDRSQGVYIKLRLGLRPQQKLPQEIVLLTESGHKTLTIEREDQLVLYPNCKSKEHGNLDCIGTV